MRRNIIAVFAFGLYLLSSATTIEAAPIGPVSIPPGGIGFTISGEVGIGSGLDLTYSNFDFTAFDQLWWGLGNIGSAMDGAIDSPQENMSLVSMSQKVATWTGSTTIITPTGSFMVDTRFTATITDILRGSWLDPFPLDIDPAVANTVAEITRKMFFNDAFSVNLLYEARFRGSSTYSPFLSFFDANSNTSQVQNVRMDRDQTWHYTVVPVPAAIWLFGSGLIGLIGIARRKKA